jgi:hypothetical protein
MKALTPRVEDASKDAIVYRVMLARS